MLPFLDGPNPRRTINLSGTSTSTSQSTILEQAKARRNERIEQKRRTDAAVRLQAWFRGIREARRVRAVLRDEILHGRVGDLSVDTLRRVVLVGCGDVLDRWAEGVDIQRIWAEQREGSWIVCMKQISRLLVAGKPGNTIPKLQILQTLLSSKDIQTYLLAHSFYPTLRQSILTTPKTHATLPHLITLATLPPPHTQLFTEILTIPLLPNRLPLQTLTYLSSHLPLHLLHTLQPPIDPTSLSTQLKIDLLANLLAFTPPRYTKLPPPALGAYLSLLADLLNALPAGALEPPLPATHVAADDEDDIHVSVVDAFLPPPEALPKLDPKTLKRLSVLPTPAHLGSLFASAKSPVTRYPLIRFLLALVGTWPSKRQGILSFAWGANGAIVKELWRGWVRSSGLGRDSSSTAMDVDSPGKMKEKEEAWPALLLLCEMYNSALLTMGDDEFFSTSTTSATRNPLSLDEITSLTRMLLNIAWNLYMSPSAPSSIATRTIITQTLQAIHARDSRKPFIPASGWLVSSTSSSSEWQTFLEAAVAEEQAYLDSLDTDIPSSTVEEHHPRINLPRFFGPRLDIQTAPLGGTRGVRGGGTGKKKKEYLGPRQAVLNNIPFVIPFEVRVAVFREYVRLDAIRNGVARDRYTPHQRRSRIDIRRTHLAQDGFDKISAVGDGELKRGVEIVFVDRWGEEEAGIDGGGVFKEFLTSLSKEVFDTDRGLWRVNKRMELVPSAGGVSVERRVLGKAMYDGILVDVVFANFFLGKWLNRQSYLDDLASLDPELYNGLIFLKHYPAEKVEELGLVFSLDVEEFGVTKTHELIPGGSSTPVTASNRLQYIYLVSHFKLRKEIKKQSEAFFDGLEGMVEGRWVRMFSQPELQILLGGSNTPIDIADLRAHTNYGGLYDDREPTIEAFWDVVKEFDQEQRSKLLRFVTSCSRGPLLGFKELQPHFAIRDAGTDQNRLPTASTCVNLLKLPRYTDKAVLKQKLLQAINAGAGFDLS
ncbi:ubiquitin-protein ligase (E3) [Paramarasmius palmivorus]|uniref:HECT-type E3 ubiquitin transferase n=1 Tax=Paramarasmius palmivorus TaxID=297713 RepID=A0AAW0CU17_9AGAR